jgi:hypothetical protein
MLALPARGRVKARPADAISRHRSRTSDHCMAARLMSSSCRALHARRPAPTDWLRTRPTWESRETRAADGEVSLDDKEVSDKLHCCFKVL